MGDLDDVGFEIAAVHLVADKEPGAGRVAGAHVDGLLLGRGIGEGELHDERGGVERVGDRGSVALDRVEDLELEVGEVEHLTDVYVDDFRAERRGGGVDAGVSAAFTVAPVRRVVAEVVVDRFFTLGIRHEVDQQALYRDLVAPESGVLSGEGALMVAVRVGDDPGRDLDPAGLVGIAGRLLLHPVDEHRHVLGSVEAAVDYDEAAVRESHEYAQTVGGVSAVGLLVFKSDHRDLRCGDDVVLVVALESDEAGGLEGLDEDPYRGFIGVESGVYRELAVVICAEVVAGDLVRGVFGVSAGLQFFLILLVDLI